MIRRRTASLPESTIWPDALPKPNEQYYFSITSCANSRPMWGFHDAHDEENATIWSNPLLDEKHIYDSSRTISDRVEDFCSYVTKDVGQGMHNPCDYIFGKNCPVSLESASWEAVSRGCKITVYVVGTNTLQLELVSKLFAVIPSRVYLMKSADFFAESDSSDNSIEVDRLAALRGAAHCEGFPAILFDAGDFLTYTAADEEGRILGGGVSQGLSMRVSTMNGRSDAGVITLEDLDVILEEVTNNEKELNMFSKDTTESVVAAAVSEVSCHIANVVKMWWHKVGLPRDLRAKRSSSVFPKVNANRVVSFIGENASVVEKLLQGNSEVLTESPRRGSALKINTSLSRHFIPDGIQSAISDQTKIARDRIANNDRMVSLSSTDTGEVDILSLRIANTNDKCSIVSPNKPSETENVSKMNYINKRVAKEVTENDYKQGEIQSVVNNDYGIALYSIKFDDGSTDQASLKMIIEMHTLYKKIAGGIVTPSQITTGNEPPSTTQKRKRGRPRKTPQEHVKLETSTKSRTGLFSKDPKTFSINGQEDVKLETRKKSRKINLFPKFQSEDEKTGTSKTSDETAASHIGKKVAKYFGSKFFIGEVKEFSRTRQNRVWWTVVYEDGDTEEFNDNELDEALDLFKSVRPN